MKTTFYTLGSILFAILLISYFFKGCEEQGKEDKIKEQHQLKLLTNATVFSVNDNELPLFAQKFMGFSRYNVAVTVFDSSNVEQLTKYIYIDKPCFDTLNVGQKVDYLKFSQQAKLSVNNSIGNGYILQVFVILLSIGVLFYGLDKILERFRA